MLGRTPNESMLLSKKLLALVSNNLRTTGVILVLVIKRPKKNKNFLRAISDSTEYSFEGFESKYLGVNLETKKTFLRNHCWHLSNFSVKVELTANSSTPCSKEARQACRQNLIHTNGSTFRRSKPDANTIPGFVNVIFDVKRE